MKSSQTRTEDAAPAGASLPAPSPPAALLGRHPEPGDSALRQRADALVQERLDQTRQEAGGPSAATAPTHAAGGTVLVVDDEPLILKVAVRTLERAGLTALTAKDGLQALATFRRHQDQVGCVLCDLCMPDMDGWQTLAALRKLAPGLPVILCSGHDDAEARASEHSERPQVFLSKPYSFETLVQAIGRVMPRLAPSEGPSDCDGSDTTQPGPSKPL